MQGCLSKTVPGIHTFYTFGFIVSIHFDTTAQIFCEKHKTYNFSLSKIFFFSIGKDKITYIN